MSLLTGDQAIFTSVRTPMGEGYRIIAASKGVRPEEKQAITRSSPSHGGLCSTGPQSEPSDPSGFAAKPCAVACYPLPTGRVCLAVSCNAGAEHTARGGQRIYTYNLLVTESDFAAAGYQPFAILRAMMLSGAAEPQLKPPAVLEELELDYDASFSVTPGARATALLADHSTCAALEHLFEQRRVIVNLEGAWHEVAEALILAMPGPLRTKTSFAVGLTYSINRSHQLAVLLDADGKTKTRIAGQPIAYIDADEAPAASGTQSSWIKFVQRQWRSGGLDHLSERTSRGFRDCGPEARERLGRLFSAIDHLGEMETGAILGCASEHLQQPARNDDGPFVGELLAKSRQIILQRVTSSVWSKVSNHWQPLILMLGTSARGFDFAMPIVDAALQSAAASSPIDAARAAFDLALASVPASAAGQIDGIIAFTLQSLAGWAQQQPAETLATLRPLCMRWKALRGECPHLERLIAYCERASVRPASAIK